MDLEITQTHPLWDSATGQQLEGHKWHMGRKQSDWKQGECQETDSSRTSLQKPGSGIVPSPRPPSAHSHKAVKWVPPPW